jgi:glutathione S-transferase
MLKLIQYRLCPLSRSVRLALAEMRMEVELAEEKPWEFRDAFLAINPAGELPVLIDADAPPVCGVYAIAEYLGEQPADDPEEEKPFALFPGRRPERAEVRRATDWFNGKLHREVSCELLHEKVYGGLNKGSGHVPDTNILRAARANLRYHMSYVNHLADERRWLAGDAMSFADLAAAAQFSSLDYLGEVPWEEFPVAKSWYARMKSRPAFRAILADRIPGVSPPGSYADLDF